MTTHGLERCTFECGDVERDCPNLHLSSISISPKGRPNKKILNLREIPRCGPLLMGMDGVTKPGSVNSEFEEENREVADLTALRLLVT